MRTVEVDSWEEFEETNFEPETKYILTSDINLQGESIDELRDFYGVLDGNGHTIRNLNSSKDRVSIFNKNNGIIKNLKLEGFEVENKVEIGGICMLNMREGAIQNCHVSGKFKSEGDVGGIASRSMGDIKSCTFEGRLESEDRVGGIVAAKKDGIIKHCTSSGNIVGGFRTGGIASENDYGVVRKCSSDATLTNELGSNGVLGGIVGRNYSKTSDSYFHGELVREKAYYKDEDFDMEGLLVGLNSGKVENCHCRNSDRSPFLVGKNEGTTNTNSFKETIEEIKKAILINQI